MEPEDFFKQSGVQIIKLSNSLKGFLSKITECTRKVEKIVPNGFKQICEVIRCGMQILRLYTMLELIPKCLQSSNFVQIQRVYEWELFTLCQVCFHNNWSALKFKNDRTFLFSSFAAVRST